MSRVKIVKSELWDEDIPAICMICGEKPAQVRHETRLARTFFPLSLLGTLGDILAPQKISFKALTCDECRQRYLNEATTHKIFGLLYLSVWIYLGYLCVYQLDEFPKVLAGPAIALFCVIFLNFVYWFSIGKNSAIRCVGMDQGTVSLEFPNGHWGVKYTVYKREKGHQLRGGLPQKPTKTVAPSGPAAAPAAPAAASNAAPPAAGPGMGTPPAPVAEPSPPGAPKIDHSSHAAPGPELSYGGGGLQLEGEEQGQIPTGLSGFLAVVKEGDTDLIDVALKKGGDLHETLPNGMNALHLAATAGLMQMADLLIRKGLDVNSEMANGLTPMHLAVQSNNQGLVGLLLAKKGSPNHPNQQGRTPLHWCAAVRDERLDPNNRYKMAQLLVKGGADISLKDETGKTAAMLATEGGEEQVAEALL